MGLAHLAVPALSKCWCAEEKQLTAAFGKTYEDSLKRVDAGIPFKNLK
jgi:protein-S-isoprenylcysteine O-methyltransferase Ste14